MTIVTLSFPPVFGEWTRRAPGTPESGRGTVRGPWDTTESVTILLSVVPLP